MHLKFQSSTAALSWMINESMLFEANVRRQEGWHNILLHSKTLIQTHQNKSQRYCKKGHMLQKELDKSHKATLLQRKLVNYLIEWVSGPQEMTT